MTRALEENRLREMEDDWLVCRYGASHKSEPALLHDTYFGGKSSGALQTRDEFLEEMRRPLNPAVKVSHHDRCLHQLGATVISAGVTELAGAGGLHRYRYLRVYHLDGRRLTLVASQSAIVR